MELNEGREGGDDEEETESQRPCKESFSCLFFMALVGSGGSHWEH